MRLSVLMAIISLIAGCVASSPAHRNEAVAEIQKLDILIIADKRPMQVEVPEPDYSKAADIATVYKISNGYKAQVSKAADAIQPLVSTPAFEGRLKQLGESVRNHLAAKGVVTDSIRVQTFDGNAHARSELEDRLESAPRSAALLELVPTMMMSGDYRILTLSVEIKVYSRAPGLLAADEFTMASQPVGGDDPIQEWTTNGAKRFSSWMADSSDQLGDKVSTLISGATK